MESFQNNYALLPSDNLACRVPVLPSMALQYHQMVRQRQETKNPVHSRTWHEIQTYKRDRRKRVQSLLKPYSLVQSTPDDLDILHRGIEYPHIPFWVIVQIPLLKPNGLSLRGDQNGLIHTHKNRVCLTSNRKCRTNNVSAIVNKTAILHR